MCWLFEGERITTGIHMKSTHMDLHHPPGWTIEQSKELTFSDPVDFRSQYKFLRSENGLNVFWTKSQEQKSYR